MPIKDQASVAFEERSTVYRVITITTFNHRSRQNIPSLRDRRYTGGAIIDLTSMRGG